MTKQLILFTTTLTLLITACNFSSSHTKVPEIKNEDELSATLDSLVTSEGMNINGTYNNVNGTETVSAELIVYNAEGLEKGVLAKKKVARKLAKAFYQSIENRKEYNQIIVTFVFQDGHYTEQQRVGFTPKELR